MLRLSIICLLVSCVVSVNICTGHTPMGGQTEWKHYSQKATYVDVDLTHCGFTATPIVLSSLQGKGSMYVTMGGASPYSVKSTSFRSYIYSYGGTSGMTIEAWAKDRGWYMSYIAIEDPSNVGLASLLQDTNIQEEPVQILPEQIE
eukprot:TRINITY_DN856_c0_g1_i6.p2 TRINITY_DN856_c0_g1~~TRINITY_DN856_c0_g1_i6.p2  ORF type:complete len:146 (-),score=14.17 TRINITY_DN856_c0_g1_i6:209-646(-)